MSSSSAPSTPKKATDRFHLENEKWARLCETQQRQIDALTSQVKTLTDLVRHLQHLKFGRSSEAIDNLVQGELFDAPTPPIDAPLPSTPDTAEDSKPGRKKRGGRRPLPQTLETRRVVHTLTDAERLCACGCLKKKIGEDVSEQLDIIPARLVRIEHVREKYGCVKCQTAPVQAPLPATLLPKTRATDTLLAQIIANKFLYHLPFYRQALQLQAMGFDIGKANLIGWAIRLSDAVQPLIERLSWHLYQCHTLQGDETRFVVDKRTDYAWLWRGRYFEDDGTLYTVVLFKHESSRSLARLNHFLKEWNGVALQTDGLPLYRSPKVHAPSIMQGCMAHARRRFHKCVRGLPKAVRQTHVAYEFLQDFKALYRIEREMKSAGAEERYRYRQRESVPILNKIRARLDKLLPKTRPSCDLGDALYYLDSEWNYITRYCDFGELEIDNNQIENCVRPFALGRRNWMHAKSERGAAANCVFYTLLATAKANGVNPVAYLEHIFKELARLGRNPSVEALDNLMPWSASTRAALSQEKMMTGMV